MEHTTHHLEAALDRLTVAAAELGRAEDELREAAGRAAGAAALEHRLRVAARSAAEYRSWADQLTAVGAAEWQIDAEVERAAEVERRMSQLRGELACARADERMLPTLADRVARCRLDVRRARARVTTAAGAGRAAA